jgi:hypothetical protein
MSGYAHVRNGSKRKHPGSRGTSVLPSGTDLIRLHPYVS